MKNEYMEPGEQLEIYEKELRRLFPLLVTAEQTTPRDESEMKKLQDRIRHYGKLADEIYYPEGI